MRAALATPLVAVRSQDGLLGYVLRLRLQDALGWLPFVGGLGMGDRGWERCRYCGSIVEPADEVLEVREMDRRAPRKRPTGMKT
jgi:hypothetical protein